jgi:Fe-S cluster assembly ATP-binding protein
MKLILSINNLHASVGNKEILKGVSFSINEGETHAIMGPNGSGKSSLALTLAGHPNYKITSGSLTFKNNDLSALSVSDRAKHGLFLAFQDPAEIEGVALKDLLYNAYFSKYPNASLNDFEKILSEKMDLLHLKPDFVQRSVNYKLSGGEKKQSEMLQIATLEPSLVILDEIDSGLDIDALKRVCNCLNAIKKSAPATSILLITHYPRILHYIEPHFVHIMKNGTIIKSGTKELSEKIEKEGYNEKI